MASPGSLSPGSPHSPKQAIDDLLMCPVCLEPFHDPRTLCCLHTFCSLCLEQCRRPYRREITCPVCKKPTSLPPTGIQGLQNDFRIQQIKDILQKQHVSPVKMDESPPASPLSSSTSASTKDCDLCKAQTRQTSATNHCVQCCMFFCQVCNEKHQKNTLFSSHHVIDISTGNPDDVLFCRLHVSYALRYFCRTCSVMLCTICTMEHDATHTTVTLDKSIIQQYNQNMLDMLKMTNGKLSDVKSHIKYLETYKQTYKKALYDAQKAIYQRASEAVAEIREEEKALLTKAQEEMETRMKSLGLENIVELNFHRNNIESLQTEVQIAMKDSPQNYLMMYEDLMNRMGTTADLSLPSVQCSKTNAMILQFVPRVESLGIQLGTFKECPVSDSSSMSDEHGSMQGSPPNSPYGGTSFTSLSRGGKSSMPKRMTSILNALSSKKGEVKIGKVKAFSNQPDKSKNNAINADDLLDAGPSGDTGTVPPPSAELEEPVPSTSAAAGEASSSPPSSPTSGEKARYRREHVTLVYKIDQVGGWPGKIMSPSGVDFLPDGSIVVAECDNRLQIFDTNGQSLRIIGWGKIKPQGVTVTPSGQIAITDKKDKCVKVFTPEGECRSIWGSGLFSFPAGIASTPSGNFVVADVDRHVVSVHGSDGALLTQFGCWGSGDYQFNSPTYLAVTQDEQIVVSDSCNGYIKIFDKKGTFIRKFSTCSGHVVSELLRRPQGVCVDSQGNILIADRENHRVSMFTIDGKFVKHMVSRINGVKYPVDVRASPTNLIAVVECHNGFLTKEPHNAVKLYKL